MYKLTPDATKMIKAVAITLPVLQKKNPSTGKLMFRKLTKRIQGKDLPKDYKKKNDWSPMGYYTYTYEEPILVNHELNLIEVYRKDGNEGVNHYVNALVNFLSDLPPKPPKKSVFKRLFELFFIKKTPTK